MNTRSLSSNEDSHSVLLGYLMWIFGFFGAHRFYFGKRKSGTLYFFTLLGLYVLAIIVGFRTRPVAFVLSGQMAVVRGHELGTRHEQLLLV